MEVATKFFNIFQSLIPVLLSDTVLYCPLLLLALPKCTQKHSEAEDISKDK